MDQIPVDQASCFLEWTRLMQTLQGVVKAVCPVLFYKLLNCFIYYFIVGPKAIAIGKDAARIAGVYSQPPHVMSSLGVTSPLKRMS